jgi:hypothetical protein
MTLPLTRLSFCHAGVQDLIKQHKTGFNAVQAYSDDANVMKTGYIDVFCRTRCAIKYHLVLTDEGEVRPLNIEQAPNDIHEFIGYRLPDEVYYYLVRGLIGPQVVTKARLQYDEEDLTQLYHKLVGDQQFDLRGLD